MVFMVIFMVLDPRSISSGRARKGARSAHTVQITPPTPTPAPSPGLTPTPTPTPIQADAATQRLAKHVLGRRKVQPSGSPVAPCLPFCEAHLEQYIQDGAYKPNPLLTLSQIIVGHLQEINGEEGDPTWRRMHRVPYVPQCPDTLMADVPTPTLSLGLSPPLPYP